METPEETLMPAFNKHLKQLLIHHRNGLDHSELKASVEILSSFGFVEIIKTKNNTTGILDLIQTYLTYSGHHNAQKAATIYLEFLEAGILEIYSAHQNILDKNYDENSVFDREEKLSIINKV